MRLKTGEFKDAQDIDLGTNTSMSNGYLTVGQLVKKFPDMAPLFDNHRKMLLKHGDFQQVLQYHEKVGIPLPKDIEKQIVDNPASASYYAANVLKKRWPEAEPYILKSDNTSHLTTYIKGVGRVPSIEKDFIKQAKKAKDPKEIQSLADNMLKYVELVVGKKKERLPDIEQAILSLQDQEIRTVTAGDYATQHTGQRFPEAEGLIGSHRFWGFIYDEAFGTKIWDKKFRD